MMSQKFERDQCIKILTARKSKTVSFQADGLDLSVQMRIKIYGAFTVSLSIKTF